MQATATAKYIRISPRKLRRSVDLIRGRHLGRRPQTRGVAMNPVDHPHGGGEAHHTPGGHPVTPWGKPEGRTRRRKPSDQLIVRRRRKGRGR